MRLCKGLKSRKMMFIDKRIRNIRNTFEENNIDALFIASEENRKYLSGFNGEDSSFTESSGFLFITTNKLFLATDMRFFEQAKIEAPLYEIISCEKGMMEKFAEIVSVLKIKKLGFESKSTPFLRYKEMTKNLKNLQVKLIPTNNIVENLRIIKDKKEIKKIRSAISIAENSFENIIDFFQEGISEEALAWEIEKKIRTKGAKTFFSYNCCIWKKCLYATLCNRTNKI